MLISNNMIKQNSRVGDRKIILKKICISYFGDIEHIPMCSLV